jgi:hypothetical protein
MQGGSRGSWLPISDLRSMLLLDSDVAAVEWLDVHNVILGLPSVEGSEGQPAILVVKEFGGLEARRLSPSTRSQFILDKAKGRLSIPMKKDSNGAA